MSLPGSTRRLDDGTMCINQCGRAATQLVQGETDSFGAEYNPLCDECAKLERQTDREMRQTHLCNWCGGPGPVSYARDMDEGMGGPVYLVCSTCLRKQSEAAEEEMAYHRARGHWLDD